MPRGPRSVEALRRAGLLQQEVWRQRRRVAHARADVSGFGTVAGVFLSIVFACVMLISHQPWWIFAGLTLASLAFAWQSILSAERHLARVPNEWTLKAVAPFSEELTHQVFELAPLPKNTLVIVDQTLDQLARLLNVTRVKVPEPMQSALGEVARIAEQAMAALLVESPEVQGLLRAARGRPKDPSARLAGETVRHRIHLPSQSFEGVTAALMAAVTIQPGGDEEAILDVCRDLIERLSAPLPNPAADEVVEVEEVPAAAAKLIALTQSRREEAQAAADDAATSEVADPPPVDEPSPLPDA